MRENRYLEAIIFACDMELKALFDWDCLEAQKLHEIKSRVKTHLRFGDPGEDKYLYLELKDDPVLYTGISCYFLSHSK